MTPLQADLEYVLRTSSGVVVRAEHPRLASAIAWRCRSGQLVSVLPGVYVPPSGAKSFDTLVRAAMAWERDAVLVGRAAARLTFWPDLPVSDVTLSAPTRRASPPGYRVDRRRIPAELVIESNGVRCTAPALTALDLCEEIEGDGIDTVLRTRSASLADLHGALLRTRKRRGNGVRQRTLLESRSEPWSKAERRAHALLNSAGITGWLSNYPVSRFGVRYYIDIAFPELKVAIEIDGRRFHGTETFEQDRWRQNDLVADGWRVLRITWDMIERHPHKVLAMVRELLAA